MSDLQPAPATPSGQGQATVQPAKDTVANTSDAAFLEYAWEDGTKESFQTKEDALRYFREGTLRHRDYTKKTQEVAKQREAQTKREKELEQTAQEILARKAKIDPLDKFLTDRPDIADYIAKQMRNPSSDAQQELVKKMIEESVKPLQEKLTEAEKWKKDQETATRRDSLFTHLGTQYPDFNREAIEKRIAELDQVPEGDEERSFIELVYLAEKARNPNASPAKIEEKVMDSLAAKAKKQSPVPSMNAAPGKSDDISQVMKSKDPIRAAAERYKKIHA
jgi:hypothetical protein